MEEIKEKTAKDFAVDKVEEILNIIEDLKYARSMYLIHVGADKIEKLAHGILEHLEYLDINKIEEEN